MGEISNKNECEKVQKVDQQKAYSAENLDLVRLKNDSKTHRMISAEKVKQNLICSTTHIERECEVDREGRRQRRRERKKTNIGKGIGEWDFVGDRLFPAVSSEPSGS